MVNCKSDQELNPKTGRCIKKCAPGTIRNPNTGRCIKGAVSAADASEPASKPKSSIKKKSSTKKKCPEGKELNPKTGNCIKKCAPGTVRNPNTGRCIKGAAPVDADAPVSKPKSYIKKCPEGKELNPKTGNCIKKCAPGTIRNQNTGRCIKGAEPAPAPVPEPSIVPPRAEPPRAEPPNSLVTSADVRKRALFLNTICSDSGICLAFGKEDAKIKRFFDGFNTFTYTQPVIRRVGAVSANGFVNMLEYNRSNYRSHAILKSSTKTNGDNLYYEFLVGYYFINNQKRKFPCFVETYGLFKYIDVDKWKDMQTENKNISNLNTYLISLDKHDPGNISKSCENSKLMTVLIENIKGAKTVNDMLKDPKFVEFDLIGVLFQVYAPLSHLAREFTHYDLHTSNVLVHCPFNENKYIMFHYHLQNGETITFKSKYIAKIIDYGRSFYTNKPGSQLSPNDFNYSSKKVIEKVCTIAECNKGNTKCGKNLGYQWLTYPSKSNNFFISAKTNNISHDLRFLNIVYKVFQKLNTKKGPIGFLVNLFNKIIYSGTYGTQQIETRGYKIGNNYNNKTINNVYDAFDAIMESIRIPMEKIRNDEYYKYHTKVGDLHIYFDGKDMVFQPV